MKASVYLVCPDTRQRGHEFDELGWNRLVSGKNTRSIIAPAVRHMGSGKKWGSGATFEELINLTFLDEHDKFYNVLSHK